MADPIPFLSACKSFFGLKDGQKLTEFRDECNLLTKQDKEDLKPLLEKALNVTIAPV
jgi:hypothetical protein